MLPLSAGQFTDFFHAVHGYEPFKLMWLYSSGHTETRAIAHF